MAIAPEVLRRLYVDEGLTMAEIAARFQCGATTVRRRLRREGIVARRRGPTPERYAARHPRMSRTLAWSPSMAWTVGLMATDGNLSRRYALSITSKDRDLLETVKDCLGLTNALGVTTNGHGGRYWKLQWRDRRFYEWLTVVGLTPAKSLTLGPLAVPDEFFADFLRGCLDGDGSVLVYTDRSHTAKNPRYVYDRLYVSLVSASRPFIDWIASTIRRLLAARSAIHLKSKHGGAPVYVLRFAKKASIQVLRWIYYNPALPCLARKRARAAAFLSAPPAGILAAGGVVERNTRRPQKPLPARAQGFKSPLPHHSPTLTGLPPGLYREASRGAVAQLGEHKAGSLGVRGSNPLSSTIFPAR